MPRLLGPAFSPLIKARGQAGWATEQLSPEHELRRKAFLLKTVDLVAPQLLYLPQDTRLTLFAFFTKPE
jgi:hypothetical protein